MCIRFYTVKFVVLKSVEPCFRMWQEDFHEEIILLFEFFGPVKTFIANVW